MRTLNKNKQKMFYSLVIGKTPVYAKDENGDIKYIEVDGVRVPVETGDYETLYGNPIEFKANISSTLASAAFKPFGVDNSANMATICCDKGYLDLKIGAIIWKSSSVQYKDNLVDGSSADFVVKGIDIEGLNNDLFLLERLNV